MPRRQLAVLLAAGATLLALGPAQDAAAHAELVDTTPAAGSQLDASPPTIELTFSEDVALVGDAVRLLDADGADLEIGEATVDGAVVSATVPSLPDGGYVVDWRVVSDDGHPISGAFTFAVGDAPVPTAPGSAGGSTATDQGIAVPLSRATTNAGFALVLGASAFLLWCWPAGRARRGAGRLVTAGALVALVGATVRVLAETSSLGATLDETIGLRSGKAWCALVLLAAAGLALAPVLRSGAPTSALTAGWAVYAVAFGLATALGGHGSSGRAPLLGSALTIVHVIVASVWVGGLAALALCVLRAPDGTARRAAVAFSGIATTCLLVLVASGTAQSLRQLGALGELTSTSYGRVLVVKVAVVALLALVGLWSRRIVRGPRTATPDLQRSSLPRSLAIECGLAVVVFGVTGWLAGEPPGSRVDASPSTPDAGQEYETTTTSDGVNASVRLAPATVGSNRLEIVVITDDGRTPDEVTVSIEPADGEIAAIDVPVDDAGAGAVAGQVDIPYAGSWYVDLAARFGEFDQTDLQAVVNVSPAG